MSGFDWKCDLHIDKSGELASLSTSQQNYFVLFYSELSHLTVAEITVAAISPIEGFNLNDFEINFTVHRW